MDKTDYKNVATNGLTGENTVDVFIAEFYSQIIPETVAPQLRNEYILSSADLLTRQQRYCVWKLLDLLLFERLGRGVDEIRFERTSNGQWIGDGICISLSHSGNCVMAAASDSPVGADVEFFDENRFDERLAKRILTDREQALYAATGESDKKKFVAELWTKKESAFKLRGGERFVPSATETSEIFTQSEVIDFGKNRYVFSVAADTRSAVRVRKLTFLRGGAEG